MKINEVQETILKWVKSCDKEEQIDLLAEVVAEFVVMRFEGKEDKRLIEITRDYLLREMAEQKLIIKRLYFHSLPAGQTIREPNIHNLP